MSSKAADMLSRTCKGLQFLRMVTAPRLCAGVILPIFHLEGNLQHLTMYLNNFVIAGANSTAHSLRHRLPSPFADFDVSKWLSTLLTLLNLILNPVIFTWKSFVGLKSSSEHEAL